MEHTTEQGIFPHMTDEEYFSKGELHNSDFRLLSESALHLKNKELFSLEGGKFVFGSALHCKVLEPELFDERYAIETFEGSDLNKNSKAYKEARATWIESAKGKDILTADDNLKLEKMAKNVEAIMGTFLSGGDAEVAMFADIDGVMMSGKADYVNHKYKYIFDLKTTASIAKFGTSAVDFNYISQSALYSDIYSTATGQIYKFAFILVETTAPYMVSLRTADDEMIEIGRSIYGEMITRYKEFRDQGIVNIEKKVKLPKWFLDIQRGER
ncbi:MAG: PD-(D/E)XK nuclease-like domain-containing protein [Caldisericia bacterium]|nr:PD-(D/E)XK nuclease-like domain-containing protein [Caldisericia bacterium]